MLLSIVHSETKRGCLQRGREKKAGTQKDAGEGQGEFTVCMKETGRRSKTGSLTETDAD